MSKAQKGAFLVSTAAIFAAIVLGFQNCSQTKFTEAPDASILKTEVEENQDTSSAGDDAAMTDTPSDTSGEEKKKKEHPSHANNGGKKEHSDSSDAEDSEDSVETADIVECQMQHPNRKIVLGPEIAESPSNASSTRVCMSRQACLELVNAYAARHECSLATGAGQDPQQPLQCTKIFPGSHGTCHNAHVLTDDEVTAILNRLASK